jgi:hypothetical protein
VNPSAADGVIHKVGDFDMLLGLDLLAGQITNSIHALARITSYPLHMADERGERKRQG